VSRLVDWSEYTSGLSHVGEPMSALTKSLKALLADVFTVYLQAHGYHWNVEGADFSQYHALFDSIVDDTYGSIDPIAENIRKMEDVAPFTLEKLIELRTIEFRDVQVNPKAMAKELLKTNESLVERLKEVFKVANDADEQGIANFIAERIDMHQKWSWQLRVSIK